MIKPLNSYILLKKDEAAEVKVGNIVLSTKKKEEGNVAKIVAISDSVKSKELSVGDKVIFKEYSTTSYKDGEDEYLLIKEEDVLAIVK